MRSRELRILRLGIGGLAFLVLFSATALAVPALMNYQGYLTDAGGKALNGDVTMTFRIWDAEVSGTELWSESHAAVVVSEGVFNVVLGSSVAITEGILDGDRYLGITVGTDSEMLPRMKLTSVAYSIRAGYAESVANGSVHESALSNAAVTETKIASGAVSSAKLGSASVTSDKIASSAVSSEKLASGSVTGAKVAAGTLTATHLQDGAALTEILDDDGPGSGLNADLLDSLDSSAFALSTHNHDATYVNEGQANSVATAMVQNGAVTKGKLSASGGTSGQVLGTDGTNLLWQSAGSGWGLTGNAGTNPDTNFIGTTDNQGLTFKVNNVRALQIIPTADTPNIITGYHANYAYPGVRGATIGGGGWYQKPNVVSNDFGTISGGEFNTAGGPFGTSHATVGGGYLNTAYAAFATIPGGRENYAVGDFSFAAGRKAWAYNPGCFVWGDSTDAYVNCEADNRWVARASGGVYFYTNSTLSSGVYVSAGGSGWNTISDRNLKENFASVDGKRILERLSEVPISTWNYKSQDSSIRHIGPVSQDFAAAFGLGESDKHINTIDVDGVSLAAIQGLYRMVKEKEAEIERIARENRELREAIDNINRRLIGMALPVASLNEK